MGFEIVGVHNHLQFNNEFKKKLLFIAGKLKYRTYFILIYLVHNE